MLFRHRAASRGQSLTTAVSTIAFLAVRRPGDRTGPHPAGAGAFHGCGNGMSRRSEASFDARAAVALPRYNIDHVKVVGYNNGVAHFGHRHPGKTIVSTVRCRRTGSRAAAHAQGGLRGDGAQRARLSGPQSNQELYVVPNYSYVCLGTSFFVPIHGSAVDYSTVADTICRVVLYDPDSDRIVSAARDDEAFREHVYNQQSRAVLLRLYLLAKPKSSYFVHRETLKSPSAGDLFSALRDRRPRTSRFVKLCRERQGHGLPVLQGSGRTSSPALELPRDALGRLWDRLEENPVTSYLMHALSRHVAWHTELFFTPDGV